MKIRAKYLWRADGSILENGIVEIRGKRIVSVRRAGQGTGGRGVRDLGEALLLPGFVNAHAHLELSALRGRVRSGKHFPRWLERVRRLRGGMTTGDLKASSRLGVDESTRSGTTTVVDHSYTGTSLRPLQESGIRGHLAFEMIALHPRRIPVLERTYRRMLKAGGRSRRVKIGVAPHGPYTAGPALYQAARRWIGPGQILSTHLSEHPAERELLATGGGQLRQLLLRRNLAVDHLTPPGLSPFGYMKSLGLLRPGTLLVHCNYVDGDDIRILKETRMPVVYCPRSHAFFGHPKHPVALLRKAGVTVALGTDSLTSNQTLSILDEMRFLAARRRDLSPMDLFEMATRDGARAVWGKRSAGVIARGSPGDLTALALGAGGRRQVLQRGLEAVSTVVLTIVGGVVLYDGGTG